MRFELEHDWQGNMSTPRAKVGERAKAHLLILLCAIWLIMGLIGHAPWKPLESHTVSTIKHVLDQGQWLMPTSMTEQQLDNPPLYYIVGAVFARIFQDLLPMHDAARMTSGLWMVLTLLLIGMSGRELWGKGFGRQTTFIFIASIGLVVSAHTLTPMLSALTGVAMGFYALALAKRRPYRAGILLGVGLAIGFLSTGILPFSIILLTSLMLPLFFDNWRSHGFLVTLGVAMMVAIPITLTWLFLAYQHHPEMLLSWWHANTQVRKTTHFFFLRTLVWYAWPALPLSIWALWRYRDQWWVRPKFQLSSTFFVIAFVLIGFFSNDNEIFALPLLVPLTAIAGGGIETLKRGAAGALNWFGLMLFGLIGFLIWLGWWALLTGNPVHLKNRMIFLSGMQQLSFQVIAFSAACLVTLIWLFAVFRSQHSSRSVATNWAIGMTMAWTLLMTLWLPMIDSARSYESVFLGIRKVLPEKYACVNTHYFGKSQQDLLYYYTGVKAQAFEVTQQLNCDLYLIQDERGRERIEPNQSWRLIWQGKRSSERRESFRLYQFQAS